MLVMAVDASNMDLAKTLSAKQSQCHSRPLAIPKIWDFGCDELALRYKCASVGLL
jgi:hypothetical protein